MRSAEPHDTLVLTRRDVREVLDLDACIDAVETAFALHGKGGIPAPASLGMHTEGGGFHVKAAAAKLGRHYFAAKTNGNFPGNPATSGLPTIQGVIALSDATNGRLLALMDSMEITTLRTAAATAVAARHLARPNNTVVTVVGCGVQGRIQLRALSRVLPLERVFAIDLDEQATQTFADEMTDVVGVPVEAVRQLHDAARQSDVVVTCTSSHDPILGAEDVKPGTFVAAVGADHPEKQEIAPELMRRSTVVVDVLAQCVEFGDLRHAIEAGALEPRDVHAELGEVVAGFKPGRRSEDEVVIFDSTGTALQDVAAAALVYERATESGLGQMIALGA